MKPDNPDLEYIFFLIKRISKTKIEKSMFHNLINLF